MVVVVVVVVATPKRISTHLTRQQGGGYSAIISVVAKFVVTNITATRATVSSL